jgi:hypothetical protein
VTGPAKEFLREDSPLRYRNDEVGSVLETFSIVKREDEAEFGEHRAKRMDCIDSLTPGCTWLYWI